MQKILRGMIPASAAAMTFAVSLLWGAAAVAAPIPDSRGTDFWGMFLSNYDGGAVKTLFLTGTTSTTGTVSIPGLGFSTPFSITPGAVTSVQLPGDVEVRTSNVIENKGVHVTAVDEVTVYGLSRLIATTDACLMLPTDVLGMEYIVLGYQNDPAISSSSIGTEFGVVATENGTTVTITPAVTTGTRMAGVPYSITLNQGNTYQLMNNAQGLVDLSGTIITSDRPVAVLGGNKCARIPPGYAACDHIFEQLTPVNTWSKTFLTVPLATRLDGDTFRILARDDNTSVLINGSPAAVLNRGGFLETMLSNSSKIDCDKPVLVAQYSNGSTYDGVTSDPFMMLIPPFEQYLNQYTVTTPASGFAQNFINVVAPNASVGLVTLDGSPIPAGSFTPIVGSIYSGAQLPVAQGTHNLEGPQRFGTFVYGFDSYDSYGYPGGMAFAAPPPPVDTLYLALAPLTATNALGAEHCVTATLDTNYTHGPYGGASIDFEVRGANSAVGTAVTDSLGQARFCYVGSTVGVDSIFAIYALALEPLHAEATATWIPGGCEGLPARVTDITPELDLKSRGEWIGFKVGPPLELPCYASNDMRDSFRLNDVLLSDGPARVDYDAEWGQNVYFVKFKRAAVEALFPGGGMQVVKISGLCEGVKVPVSSSIATPTGVACVTTPFCGTATLWLIEPEVQNPTAGQIVSAGSDLPISWDLPAGQEADEAAIHYSLDAGATWTTVVEHYTGSTSYTWRVPVAGTDSVVVAVESYRNGTLAGQGLSPMFQISNSTAGVTSGIPTKVYLSLPQPSPFGSSTVLRYGLPKTGMVKLSVVDITGRMVRTLVNGMQAPGIQTATWNGQDDHGRRVEAGVYLYRLEGLGVALSQKVVYLR